MAYRSTTELETIENGRANFRHIIKFQVQTQLYKFSWILLFTQPNTFPFCGKECSNKLNYQNHLGNRSTNLFQRFPSNSWPGTSNVWKKKKNQPHAGWNITMNLLYHNVFNCARWFPSSLWKERWKRNEKEKRTNHITNSSSLNEHPVY